jgi:hypothetical protein
MEQNEIRTEQPNSVEISINAKGQYSGKIKVYAETIDEAYALAIAKSNDLNTLIKQKNQ